MARKSGHFLRGGRMRRESMWIGVSEARVTAAAANTATLVTSLSASALALRPFTIVRSLIFMAIRSDQAAATENFDVAYGEAVVSDQSTAIGVTAVPTPFTDLGSDLWYLHQIMSGHFTFITGAGVLNDDSLWTQIDSRAMRKVNDDQDVIGVLENSSLSAGSTTFLAGRQLIKLH